MTLFFTPRITEPMKAVFLFTLLFSIILFAGCEEDAPRDEVEEVEVKGTFTLNGISYDIIQAYATDYGEGEFRLILITDGFAPELEGGEEFNGDGTGSMVLIYPFSSSSSEIAAGSYIFGDTFEPGTFAEARVGTSCGGPGDCDEVFFTEEDFPQTLEIAKESGIYTVTFAFNLQEENRITGAYSGDIIYY